MEHNGATTIQRISNIGKYLFLILIIILLVIAVVSMIAFIVLEFDLEVLSDDTDYDEVRSSLLLAFVACLVNAFVFYLLYKLTIHLSTEKTPFVIENVVLMKKAAVTLIIGYLVVLTADILLSWSFNMTYDVFDLSMTPLFMGIVVYFLALVFQYGVELQEESDSFV